MLGLNARAVKVVTFFGILLFYLLALNTMLVFSQCSVSSAAENAVRNATSSAGASSQINNDCAGNQDRYWTWHVAYQWSICRGEDAANGNSRFALAGGYDFITGQVNANPASLVTGPNTSYFYGMISDLENLGPPLSCQYSGIDSSGGSGGSSSGGTITASCKGAIGNAQRASSPSISQSALTSLTANARSNCPGVPSDWISMVTAGVGGNKGLACQIYVNSDKNMLFSAYNNSGYWAGYCGG